jgi:hypothetical protein
MELFEWADAFEDESQRIVAHIDIGRVCVGTIWLGLDHSFGGEVPLIFETNVFDLESGKPLEDMVRYSTEQQALEGHQAVVQKYMAATAEGPR